MTTAVSIGEVMVELKRQPDGRFALAFGGDSFNTAVYLARCGIDTAYATALGDDRWSDETVALAEVEGIETSAILRVPGRLPGLYLIETDAAGERTFFYWRETSPARDLFTLPGADAVEQAIRAARLVYVSGITLSLYDEAGLERLFTALAAARDAGAHVAFDSNYRPRGWRGDAIRARRVMARALDLATIALPTFDDERALWGDAAPEASLDRLAGHGIAEALVKLGPEGARIAHHGRRETVAPPERLDPHDTTAAGDSFNAAYLAARLAGADPAQAALAGHRLAGIVIRHPGAIAPRAETERFTRSLAVMPAGPDARVAAPSTKKMSPKGLLRAGQRLTGVR